MPLYPVTRIRIETLLVSTEDPQGLERRLNDGDFYREDEYTWMPLSEKYQVSWDTVDAAEPGDVVLYYADGELTDTPPERGE